MPWNKVELYGDIDSKVNCLYAMCDSFLNKHTPMRTIRDTRASTPWINDDIKYLMKCHDAAKRIYHKNKTDINFEKYRQLRNKVRQSIRNSRLKFSF
jgi:maltooligosyltrehalose synthase